MRLPLILKKLRAIPLELRSVILAQGVVFFYSKILDPLKLLRFAVLVTFSCASFAVHAQEVTLPVFVALTGAGSSFGNNEKDAYMLAAEEWNAKGGVNGRKVTLRFEDTLTDARTVTSLFHKTASTNPAVILGPTWLDTFQGIIPLARKRDVLLVTPSAAIEAFSAENRDWPISFYHNATREVEKLVQSLTEDGVKSPVLIYEQEPYAEMFRDLLIKGGLRFAAEKTMLAGEDDFRSTLSKIKGLNPDALVVLVWNQASLGALFKQIKVFHPSILLATDHEGEDWLKQPDLQPLISKMLYTKVVSDDASFSAKFSKRYGYEPILQASNAYDALNAVLTAMSSGAQSANEIRSFIMNNELESVSFGRFRFGKNGEIPSKVEARRFTKQ